MGALDVKRFPTFRYRTVAADDDDLLAGLSPGAHKSMRVAAVRKRICTGAAVAIILCILLWSYLPDKQVSLLDPDSLPGEWATSPSRDPSREAARYTSFSTRQALPIDSQDDSRSEFVKDMIINAWDAYMRDAEGYDDLLPISQRGYNWLSSNLSLFATPVDALDTLYVIGDMTRFEQAKRLVLDKFDIGAIRTKVNFFETVIRVIGGLLSAYELEGDIAFVNKAVLLADELMVAFNTPSGLPRNNPKLNDPNGTQLPEGSFLLAEVGSCQLEFDYLSDITGDPKYRIAAMNVFDLVTSTETGYPGLYPGTLHVYKNGTKVRIKSTQVSVGAGSDSFYEYLLKVAIATNNATLLDIYYKSADGINENLLIEFNSKSSFAYVAGTIFRGELKRSHIVEHLTCFAGGMMALGAVSDSNKERSVRHFDIGEKVTSTCVDSYLGTDSGVGPETYSVVDDLPRTIDPRYLLRPETIESVLYMYRFTGDSKWKEYGWNLISSIDEACRVPTGGFATLKNVRTARIAENPWIDHQESFFLAETLKYAYLLFGPETILPLDEYVFNTEAHPLSIRGKGRRSKYV